MSSRCNELTLLYIEDDDELRKQFARILTPRFAKIFEAADGEEALALYQEEHPDMILADINLPRIDGLELIRMIRKEDKQTPIMVLSAYSDKEKLLKAVKLGLTEYLVKPVPYKRLLTLLEEMASGLDDNRSNIDTIRLRSSYEWRVTQRVLLFEGRIIVLTSRETTLLKSLIDNINTVITITMIENSVWKDDGADHHISFSHLLKRLRKKLPEELIENIYGEGYRILSR